MVSTNRLLIPSVRKVFPILAIFTLLCGCCLFADGLPLNDSDIESKWFMGVAFSTMLCIVTVWGALKENRALVLRQTDIVAIALLLYIAVRSLPGGSLLFWLRFLFVVTLYVSFRIVKEHGKDFLPIVVCILSLLLALWGIGQWTRIFSASGRGFLVSGNFDNPAGYASALAISFPFALSVAWGRKGLLRLFAFLSSVVIILAIVASGSRAGLFAVIVVLIIGLCLKRKITRPALFVCLAVALLALLTVLYFVKKDSADGRLLVWSVSLRLVAQHPLLGGGTCTFQREYMPEQARFFEAHPDSRFALLADNVGHPFNEYLSLLVQWGVVGALLIVLLVMLIVKAWKGNRTVQNATLLLAIAALGVFSMFSYPMNYPFGWLMLTMAVGAMGSATPEVHAVRLWPKVIYLIIQLLAVTILGVTAYGYSNYFQWHAMCQHRPNIDPDELQAGYEALYPALHLDPLYLYNYAAEMPKHGNPDKAMALIAECKTLRDDYIVEHLWGDIQRSQGNNEEARTAYETMSLMCPNRFIPLYRLFQLAEEEGDAEEATLIAKSILQKPVKVESPQVDYIKKRCNTYITRQESSIKKKN